MLSFQSYQKHEMESRFNAVKTTNDKFNEIFRKYEEFHDKPLNVLNVRYHDLFRFKFKLDLRFKGPRKDKFTFGKIEIWFDKRWRHSAFETKSKRPTKKILNYLKHLPPLETGSTNGPRSADRLKYCHGSGIPFNSMLVNHQIWPLVWDLKFYFCRRC
jgi:hypothetical protein